MLYSVIITRPISKPEKPAQSTVNSVEAPSSYAGMDVDLSGLPMYYYDPIGFLIYVIVYAIWFVVWILVHIGLFFGVIFFIIWLCKNKKAECKKCGKKIRYMKKKPMYCPKCGAEIDNFPK